MSNFSEEWRECRLNDCVAFGISRYCMDGNTILAGSVSEKVGRAHNAQSIKKHFSDMHRYRVERK